MGGLEEEGLEGPDRGASCRGPCCALCTGEPGGASLPWGRGLPQTVSWSPGDGVGILVNQVPPAQHRFLLENVPAMSSERDGCSLFPHL